MDGFKKEAFKFGGSKRKWGFYPNEQSARLSLGDKLERLSRTEIQDLTDEKIKNTSNGMFGDVATSALKLFPKNVETKVTDGIGKLKTTMHQKDQELAQKLVDTLKIKDGGLAHRFLSINKPIPVAKVNPNQSSLVPGDKKEKILYDVNARTPSLIAPMHNATKIGTPLLAGMYVGDKLYGEEKTAHAHQDDYEKHGQIDRAVALELDKTAALQKVAALTEKLEITDGMLKSARNELNYYQQKVASVLREKETIETAHSEMEKVALEKEAIHNELYLRMKARERSPHAVKIAESMLEQGMIKQAEFNSKVDFLIECDDETYKLHEFISKNSNNKELTLESSPYFIETINKEEFPVYKRGISKIGQTIGEAAYDLIK